MKKLRLNGFMVLDLFTAAILSSGGGKKKEDLLDGIDIYSELRNETKAPWEKASQNENGTVLDPKNPPFRSPGDGETGNSRTDLTAPEYSYTRGAFGYGPFSYGEYAYKDQALLDAAKERVANFSYDPDNDTSYKAYARQYLRNGGDAYRNTMARLAARTGGVASSYAVQAAQGAYNDYLQQLAAKVPELRELAYQKVQDEYNLYNTEYNRDLAKWQADRDLAYDQYQDARDIAYKNWQMQESARQAAYDRTYNQKMSEYESALAAANEKQDYSSVIKTLSGMDDESAMDYIDSYGEAFGLTEKQRYELLLQAGKDPMNMADSDYVNASQGRGTIHGATDTVDSDYKHGRINRSTYNAVKAADQERARQAEIRAAYEAGNLTYSEMMKLLEK